MAETRIEDVPQLSGYEPALKALGYRSLEQFLGTTATTLVPLARYLKVDPNDLQAVVAQVAPQAPSSLRAMARRKYPLGVRLDRIQRPGFALMRAPGTVSSLPGTTNLIAEMQPVRDQGTRGTCVAHASTAAAEHYWHGQGKIVDLSRQFVYWDCKEHDGDPNTEGTWIQVAMARLQADGCCLEPTWPYVMDAIPGNEAQDPPPAAAIAEAPTYKIPGSEQISPTSVLDIKGALAEGLCVAFTIPVFNSWYENTEVERTGELVNPIPGEQNVGGHAMCLVGYEDLPTETGLGGGRFYLRNSWGNTWAYQSAIGNAGYGTIPYSYIAGNCEEAYAVRLISEAQ